MVLKNKTCDFMQNENKIRLACCYSYTGQMCGQSCAHAFWHMISIGRDSLNITEYKLNCSSVKNKYYNRSVGILKKTILPCLVFELRLLCSKLGMDLARSSPGVGWGEPRPVPIIPVPGTGHPGPAPIL
ncbi:unnamed protein product [Cuscuta epithymum]|uniref:Uncharacterized protein n=1 Tax=Cuscuta epithymum TaxID=186058 RepID=A0AAV0C681_9ASTE|nr:unnamed protein product [Cuscuta epithymum]